MRITEATRVHIADQMRDIRIMVGDAQQIRPAPVNELLLADLRAYQPMIEKATDIDTVAQHLQELIKTSEIFESSVVDAAIVLLKNLIEDLEMEPA
jgi:type II secretory pathway predicted ATPase ExeA